MSSKAVVYVLQRQDGTRHNLTKIGSTKISAENRAANYTDGGWTTYFTAEVSAHVRYAVEKKAHNILTKKGYWLDPNITGGTAQEIFTCPPQDAKDAVINAIQIIKVELSDFIDNEISNEIKRLKIENSIISRELDSSKKYSKSVEIYNESYKVINEAEHIKKLQERIRILDHSITEKDKLIIKLNSDIKNLKRSIDFDSRYRNKKSVK